ncbi:hypothetical protein Back11_60510 [Paenibacillus baekrokdamisoli]|uniref:Uncharacterized protein n=1 Tax=Paenibacillus baekrokdamisoli TaxID=1712516 RepID=A0A3G9J1S1_9BACL|nr:helix-turn-helix domain-containing protein [Paenibacillus baekrokdamisoli]MBB3072122.1 two-component system response regulator YesN [Paenibacillus baekrokdamisoli]BBH24706.1 hypothetical protein Back11_60510 [Paenibacillus baekrokdamisoli]
MYNMLVVDDEEIAIRGIIEGIDWSDLPIASFHKAYDVEEAKSMFVDQSIHILISDIDMPLQTGIDLLEWVNQHSTKTITIFLTGHADFKYAQQAVQLESFDYLLKPIDHQMLKARVVDAIERLRRLEEQEAFTQTYTYYYEQWNKQLPILVERFWQDVLSLRIPSTVEQLEPALSLYNIPLQAEGAIQTILLSIEQWKEEWTARDEEIMTYAVKNAAEELLLHDHPGHVIQDSNGVLYALLYESTLTDLELNRRCEEFIRKCEIYLYATISCYVGKPSSVRNIRTQTQLLMELERNNVSVSGSVWFQYDFKQTDGSSTIIPQLADWSALLEFGKKNELLQRVEECFERIKSEKVDHAFLLSFYYGVVNVVLSALQKKSLVVGELLPFVEWKEAEQAVKSLAKLQGWTIQFITQAVVYIQGNGKDVSQVVHKVQQYIEEHLAEDFTREDIADHVYLNSAYLSRLFRKETGGSLTDYMVDLRINKAKHQLTKANHKISDIAVEIGYTNFSHFSKLFKRATGLTPQEYRRQYQDMN